MELLKKNNYNEYETFARNFNNTNFTQSSKWIDVKVDWDGEIIVSRDNSGAIVGGMVVLIRKKNRFLYSPRGPLLDYTNEKVFADLLDGVKVLAKKTNSYMFKMDPYVFEDNTDFIKLCTKFGMVHNKKSLVEYRSLQPRVNYIINIANKTYDEIFSNFHKKWRYNSRVAEKHNVTCSVCDISKLDDFYRLISITAKRDGFICRPKAYFEKMLKTFDGDIELYMCYYEGKAISGAITSFFGNRCVYIYGASDNENRNVMPNYLMQSTMISDAVAAGCTIYDFMGISGYRDENSKTYGIYKFKNGFGGEIVPYIGEIDLVFKPFTNAIINMLINLRKKLMKIKK